eukprot:6780498-Prymnesium_polylepis.3
MKNRKGPGAGVQNLRRPCCAQEAQRRTLGIIPKAERVANHRREIARLDHQHARVEQDETQLGQRHERPFRPLLHKAGDYTLLAHQKGWLHYEGDAQLLTRSATTTRACSEPSGYRITQPTSCICQRTCLGLARVVKALPLAPASSA